MKKKEEILESKQEMPKDIKQHENGEWYKEIMIDGTDEPFKLFNTLKDIRLPGETRAEYKTRKLFAKMEKKKGYEEMFYPGPRIGYKGIPYVNENKKDKFKKKK